MEKKFQVGDMVVYDNGHKTELGKVKRLCEDKNYVFVVYNCNNEWDRWLNYTAARTSINDLRHY